MTTQTRATATRTAYPLTAAEVGLGAAVAAAAVLYLVATLSALV